MKKMLFTFVLSASLVLTAATILAAGIPGDPGDEPKKVSLCHMTSSETNEFVIVEVGSAAEQTHRDHGDVAPALDGTCPQ